MTTPREFPDNQPVPYMLTPAAEALLEAEPICAGPAQAEAEP
jgi:hypothetical protein